MVRRKKKKLKTKRKSFRLLGSKTNKDRKTRRRLKSVSLSTLTALAIICVLAAFAVGFMFFEKYVNKTVAVSETVGSVELSGAPAWVNEQLKAKIYTAATANGQNLELDKDVARSVQRNLVRQVTWLDRVKVQTTHNSIRIIAKWRKPVALIELGRQKFYVDAELVVLDFVPISTLPVVRVKGLAVEPEMPQPGQTWQREDLAAAVTILGLLDKMDKLVTPDKPLLGEIDRIDVSNFNGRQNAHSSHIILYANDNTEIIWGAEYDRWQRYLESTDRQKIAKLYQHYKQYGTLLNGVKYINLCDPQDDIPLPIDRY